MDDQLFETLLDALSPNTLARLLVDLEEAQEDWQHYPEDAPPEAVRQQLAQTLALIAKIGSNRTGADATGFEQLVDQIKEERYSENWLQERNRQARQNWLQDYE